MKFLPLEVYKKVSMWSSLLITLNEYIGIFFIRINFSYIINGQYNLKFSEDLIGSFD
jgi:hypothetical protein